MTEPLIITTSRRDDHQVEMEIRLGPERTQEALHRAARLISKRARIPGFRPGKAPFAAVLRAVGREALLQEVLEEVSDKVYREALEIEHIEPYGQASLQDVQTDPITLKLLVPLRPTVELGDYRSIRLEPPEVSVSEKDVDDMLAQIRHQRGAWQAVDRPAQLGDTVVVDIAGRVGDETIMDNQDWEVALMGGEGGWLPGFDEAFVGLQAGDEKTFTLRYPEDSSSRYRGQEATFQTTVKAVKAFVEPELDDDLARSLGDFADLADFRAQMLARLGQERAARAEADYGDKLVEALVEKATFQYPPVAVEDMLDEVLSEAETWVSELGYTLDDFLRLQGKSREDFRAQMRPAAERRLRARLAISRLAEEEGITVTPEENRAEIERIAAETGDEDEARRFREVMSSEPGAWIVYRDLRSRKAIARLREIATGAAPEPVAAEEASPAPGEPVEAEQRSEAEEQAEAEEPATAAAPPAEAPTEESQPKRARKRKAQP